MNQRVIKFRGLTLTGESGAFQPGGQWVYGYYCVNRFGEHTIFSDEESNSFARAVRKDSVGQLTGLLDKNGKEIYEGDILDYRHLDDEATASVVFGDGSFLVDRIPLSNLYPSSLEAIGNIHENPELLEKAATPSSEA